MNDDVLNLFLTCLVIYRSNLNVVWLDVKECPPIKCGGVRKYKQQWIQKRDSVFLFCLCEERNRCLDLKSFISHLVSEENREGRIWDCAPWN